MKTLFAWLRSLNQFVKDYALLLLIAAGGFYYLAGQNSYYSSERVQTRSVSNHYSGYAEESMDMAMAEPVMMKQARGLMADAIVPPIQAQGFDPENLSDRKVVKNGSLQLEVEDTEEALELAKAELKAAGAFVTHQNSYEVRRDVLAYNLTIRVPADNLEALSENLEGLGVKKSENYATRDITAQYYDTANRIKNLEVRRERLRELMGRETESISDVLEIERELTRVQTEIDNLTSTQKRRDTDVAFSTLQLTVNPRPEIGDFSNPDWNLENSWRVAVNDFMHDAREVVDKLIRVAVYTPIWLPVLLILWGLKRWLFGGVKKKAKK